MRIEELETPAVVVDLDILEANLKSMAGYAREHNLGLRPHTKTHKIPEIAAMQRQHGSRGITVAKTGEAEVMAKAGFDDILIHYPVYGDSKLDRIASLARDCSITLALDSAETAGAVSRAAHRAGSTVRILVELDSGMRRCGVASVEDAVTLGQEVARLPGLSLAGISTYPGHIWNKPDAQAPALAELNHLLQSAVDAFRSSGLNVDVVSAGSTPAGRNSHLARALTEIRPGTYVFNDRNTLGVGACEIGDCALRVLVTVVSNAVSGRAIVDGGSKTFSSDRWISGEKGGHGLVVEQPEVHFAFMSEEHGNLDLEDSGYLPRIGDRLTIIPNHVCSCVNMHDSLYFHRKGQVEGSWPVKGRGKVQ